MLFDPYLSDSLTAKYADTDKPHVRITERVIDPESLDFIDVATSSHKLRSRRERASQWYACSIICAIFALRISRG